MFWLVNQLSDVRIVGNDTLFVKKMRVQTGF